MSHPVFLAMVLMAASGAAIAAQAPVNAALGRGLSSPVAAATVSFGVGFVVLILCTVLMGEARSVAKLPGLPLWMLLGGALGAFYVFSALWSVPILGVLTTTALLVLGQIIAALLIDQFGAFGLAPREISPLRLLSGLLVLGGVVLSRF